MIQRRRGLLVSLGLSAGLLSLPIKLVKSAGNKKESKPYRVVYSCEILDGTPPEQFAEERKSWEDASRIIEIFEDYRRRDLAHSFTYENTGAVHQWQYVFASRLAYEDWSREVFLTGSFTPPNLTSRFKYSVHGEYI